MIWTRNGYVVWRVQHKSRHPINSLFPWVDSAGFQLTSNYKSIILTSMNGLQTIPPLSKLKQPPYSLSGGFPPNKFHTVDKPSCHLLKWKHVARSCSWTLALGKERDLGETFWKTTLLAHILWLSITLGPLYEVFYFDMMPLWMNVYKIIFTYANHQHSFQQWWWWW